METNLVLNIITSLSTAVAAFFVIGIFLYNRKQRQFEILEQSFDLMQRLNEVALSSDDNLIAAIKSGNPLDNTGVEAGREIYFHYMRINRLVRAYEYHRGGFLSLEQRDRIIDNHISTLRPILANLDAILARGYPDDFKRFLREELKNAEAIPVITK